MSRIFAAAAIVSLLAAAGCTTGSTNTTYAQQGQAGPSGFSIPIE